jgi:zinc/manganese transport system permease protein
MTANWGEALTFLAAPFAMCLILAGIHCYLGLHVLARGVIFVDLSLAQVAAFGGHSVWL